MKDVGLSGWVLPDHLIYGSMLIRSQTSQPRGESVRCAADVPLLQLVDGEASPRAAARATGVFLIHVKLRSARHRSVVAVQLTSKPSSHGLAGASYPTVSGATAAEDESVERE